MILCTTIAWLKFESCFFKLCKFWIFWSACMYHFASINLLKCEATLTSSNWYPVQIVKSHLRCVFHRIWQCSKTRAEIESTKSKNATDHSGLVSARAEAATYCVGQARPITNSWDSSSPLVLRAAVPCHISPHSGWEQHLRTWSEVNNTILPAMRLDFHLTYLSGTYTTKHTHSLKCEQWA